MSADFDRRDPALSAAFIYKAGDGIAGLVLVIHQENL
jgi:hypothetical protein